MDTMIDVCTLTLFIYTLQRGDGQKLFNYQRLSRDTIHKPSNKKFFHRFSVVEVIKQIEPGSMMPTAKPRLQGEVYSPKSCDPGREESDGVTGLCSAFCLFGQARLFTI